MNVCTLSGGSCSSQGFSIETLGLFWGHWERIVPDSIPVEVSCALSVCEDKAVTYRWILPALDVGSSSQSLTVWINSAQQLAVVDRLNCCCGGSSKNIFCVCAKHWGVGVSLDRWVEVIEWTRFIRGLEVVSVASLGVLLDLAI